MSTNNRIQKNFFLISFLPAFLYWYLEANYPVRVAVVGGLALSLIELGTEKLFSGRLHTISKLNFYLLVFLGGLSILGEKGIWFKLSPLFTGLGMGGFFLWNWWRNKTVLLEMMIEMKGEKALPLPPHLMAPVFQQTERDIGLFLIGYGFWMGALALWRTTGEWLFFKTAGFYVAMGVVSILEAILMRLRLRRVAMWEYQRQTLQRF